MIYFLYLVAIIRMLYLFLQEESEMAKLMKTLIVTLAISAGFTGSMLRQEPVWNVNTVNHET